MPKVGIIERDESQIVDVGNGRSLTIRERWRLAATHQARTFSGVPLRRSGVVAQNRHGCKNHFVEVLNDRVTTTGCWMTFGSESQKPVSTRCCLGSQARLELDQLER